MTTVYIYKINTKKSKIPKTLKLPKHVYHQYPENKKPNMFYHPKIDIKKSEFIVKVNKGKDWYSFERLDPYPQIWTRGGINLFRNKEHKELFQVEEKDPMFLETQSYNVSKLTYDETDKSLTNSTFHYAGKKNKELKLYGETFVHFDLINEKKTDDIFYLLPSNIKKKLNKTNLIKSFKILSKKASESKEYFSIRAFSYQNIFASYDKYNLEIVAKKLHECKFYVLAGKEAEYMDKKHFFMFLEQYISLVKKVLKTDDTAKIFTEVNTYLSFDKNKKKYLDNQKIYIDLTTEYIEESKT